MSLANSAAKFVPPDESASWGVQGEPYRPYQPYQCRSGVVRLTSWYGLSRTGGVAVGHFGRPVEGVLVRLKPYRVQVPYRP
jgi:hypothetical protein